MRITHFVARSQLFYKLVKYNNIHVAIESTHVCSQYTNVMSKFYNYCVAKIYRAIPDLEKLYFSLEA